MDGSLFFLRVSPIWSSNLARLQINLRPTTPLGRQFGPVLYNRQGKYKVYLCDPSILGTCVCEECQWEKKADFCVENRLFYDVLVLEKGFIGGQYACAAVVTTAPFNSSKNCFS